MGVLPILFMHLAISEISAFAITQIKGITNEFVNQLDFDSEGKTYVLTASKLYKLDTSNEVSSVIDLRSYDSVPKMLVNKRGDVYLKVFKNSASSLAIVRSNSTEIEVISSMSPDAYRHFLYRDNNDNIFYREGHTVHVIRPNSTALVPIRNLERVTVFNETSYYSSYATPLTDKSGDTYLLINKIKGPNPSDDERWDGKSIAIITKEALTGEKPFATIVDTSKHQNDFFVDLIVDVNSTLWTSWETNYYDFEKPTEGWIKKLVSGKWITVLKDKIRHRNTLVHSKEKNYVISRKSDWTKSLSYVTPNGEIAEIPELKNISTNAFAYIKGVSDSEGNAYFYITKDSPTPFSIIAIRPNETKPIPIAFGANDKEIESVHLDFNDDLWVTMTSGEIYHLKKGETVAKALDGIDKVCNRQTERNINFNFGTKKIYIPCAKQVFVVENN